MFVCLHSFSSVIQPEGGKQSTESTDGCGGNISTSHSIDKDIVPALDIIGYAITDLVAHPAV
jgi:hypothetical protein